MSLCFGPPFSRGHYLSDKGSKLCNFKILLSYQNKRQLNSIEICHSKLHLNNDN